MNFEEKLTKFKPSMKRKRPMGDEINVSKKKRVLYTEPTFNSTLDSNDDTDTKIRNHRKYSSNNKIPDDCDIFIPRKHKRKQYNIVDLSEDNAVHNSRKRQRQLASSPLLDELVGLSDSKKVEMDATILKINKDFEDDQPIKKIETLKVTDLSSPSKKSAETEVPASKECCISESKEPAISNSIVESEPFNNAQLPDHSSPPISQKSDAMLDSPNSTSVKPSAHTTKPVNNSEFTNNFKFGESDMKFNFGNMKSQSEKNGLFVFGGESLESSQPTASKPFVFGGTSAPDSSDSKQFALNNFAVVPEEPALNFASPAQQFQQGPQQQQYASGNVFSDPQKFVFNAEMDVNSMQMDSNSMQMDMQPQHSVESFDKPQQQLFGTPNLFGVQPVKSDIFGSSTGQPKKPIQRRRRI